MATVQAELTDLERKKIAPAADNRCSTDCSSQESSLRIALLTPYNGGNLGDGAIQDAVIANIRLRLTHAQFLGISLNNENFAERHRTAAFPLRGSAMERGMSLPGNPDRSATVSSREPIANPVKRFVKAIPVVGSMLKTLRDAGQELGHCFQAYSLLKEQNLLVVSGGGQLCDRWGGAWRHPFALFKWGLLARIAGVPYAIVSVGASPTNSRTSRFFMSAALRLAQYRSFRDKESQTTARDWLSRAKVDSIVPDLAFSMPSSELPPPAAAVRSMAKGRTIIALSVIAYAKPGRWPHENRALFERYVREMRGLVQQLVRRGYYIVIVWSSCGDDEGVVVDILGSLDEESATNLREHVHVASIATWKDLAATLGAVDYVIASRLHSTILSFICHKPAIAISFDPKVDSLMNQFNLADYLLRISDFTVDEVINKLGTLERNKASVVERIDSCQNAAIPALKSQYDKLAELALVSSRVSLHESQVAK